VDAVEGLLGQTEAPVVPIDPRITVLDRLASGEISADRAMTLLDALSTHP
jgi:hypothetical protein